MRINIKENDLIIIRAFICLSFLLTPFFIFVMNRYENNWALGLMSIPAVTLFGLILAIITKISFGEKLIIINKNKRRKHALDL